MRFLHFLLVWALSATLAFAPTASVSAQTLQQSRRAYERRLAALHDSQIQTLKSNLCKNLFLAGPFERGGKFFVFAAYQGSASRESWVLQWNAAPATFAERGFNHMLRSPEISVDAALQPVLASRLIAASLAGPQTSIQVLRSAEPGVYRAQPHAVFDSRAFELNSLGPLFDWALDSYRGRRQVSFSSQRTLSFHKEHQPSSAQGLVWLFRVLSFAVIVAELMLFSSGKYLYGAAGVFGLALPVFVLAHELVEAVVAYLRGEKFFDEYGLWDWDLFLGRWRHLSLMTGAFVIAVFFYWANLEGVDEKWTGTYFIALVAQSLWDFWGVALLARLQAKVLPETRAEIDVDAAAFQLNGVDKTDSNGVARVPAAPEQKSSPSLTEEPPGLEITIEPAHELASARGARSARDPLPSAVSTASQEASDAASNELPESKAPTPPSVSLQEPAVWEGAPYFRAMLMNFLQWCGDLKEGANNFAGLSQFKLDRFRQSLSQLAQRMDLTEEVEEQQEIYVEVVKLARDEKAAVQRKSLAGVEAFELTAYGLTLSALIKTLQHFPFLQNLHDRWCSFIWTRLSRLEQTEMQQLLQDKYDCDMKLRICTWNWTPEDSSHSQSLADKSREVFYLALRQAMRAENYLQAMSLVAEQESFELRFCLSQVLGHFVESMSGQWTVWRQHLGFWLIQEGAFRDSPPAEFLPPIAPADTSVSEASATHA